MWYLKIRYKHSDCLYTSKIHELTLSLFHFYLGSYTKGKFSYSSAFQKLEGEKKNINKYLEHLKKSKKVEKLEVYNNAVLLLTKHKNELRTYTELYNPSFLYPSPATVDKEGFEVVQIAFWEKKPLQELVQALKEDATTTHIEILHFIKKDMDDLYVARLLPKLPAKQKEAIQLAYKLGYYTFPRKVNLDTLAKIAKVSKPTFRENLRRAESQLLPQLLKLK
jgi:predicted DNA binding protein